MLIIIYNITCYLTAAMSPAFTSAQSAMSWAVCPSFPVLLPAISTWIFRMALAVVRVQSQTPILTLATAAGYLRSALGCGATGGGSQERYLWLKQKQGDMNCWVRLESRWRKPWSGARRSVGMSFTSVSTAAKLRRQMGSKFGVKSHIMSHNI